MSDVDLFSDSGFTKLPTFVILGGTLGTPKIGNPLLKASESAVTNVTSKIKSWLREHASPSNTDTNQSGTNAPGNKKSGGHLFDFLKKKE